jgi:chromosome segregation ATPase
MSDAEDGAVDPALGEPTEAAVELVREREPNADPESVRSALERVSEEGVVSPAGVQSALGEAAQHVATPENRIELTERALDDAREAAPDADLDAVRSRLSGFEARYDALAADVDALVSRLDDLVERGSHPEDVYDLARALGDLQWDVRDAHGRAEELRADLESFERWATDPTVRYDELAGDAGQVEGLLDGLATAVDELDGVTDGDAGPGTDPAVAWADATLQRRTVALLVSDLQAELSDLRAWPDGAASPAPDDAEPRPAAVEARIDDLRSRERALGERIDALARPPWRERVDDRIEAFEEDIEAFAPPINWGAVQDVLAEHRATLTEDA